MKSVNKIIHRKLGKEKAMGLAYTEEGEIHIDERLKGIDHLDTLVHEVYHCLNPKFSEIKVQGHATELAKILWDNGYRRIIE
jgi:hypothetical protein